MAEARRKGQTNGVGETTEDGGEVAKAAPATQKYVDAPPTWRGAALRAFVAACALALLAGIELKASAVQTIAYFAVGLVAYAPISYYTDNWIYKRRQRK